MMVAASATPTTTLLLQGLAAKWQRNGDEYGEVR
jgi:hypothetical protein